MILGSAALSLWPQSVWAKVEASEMLVSELPPVQEHIRHGLLGQEQGWSPWAFSPLQNVQRHRFFANGRGPGAKDLEVWQWEWNGSPQVISVRSGKVALQMEGSQFNPGRYAKSPLNGGEWQLLLFEGGERMKWEGLDRPLVLVPVKGSGIIHSRKIERGILVHCWKAVMEMEVGKDGLVVWVGAV